jgi:hypothetical protein
MHHSDVRFYVVIARSPYTQCLRLFHRGDFEAATTPGTTMIPATSGSWHLLPRQHGGNRQCVRVVALGPLDVEGGVMTVREETHGAESRALACGEGPETQGKRHRADASRRMTASQRPQ